MDPDPNEGDFLDFYFFYVLYSKLLHLPPLKFHFVGGYWNGTHAVLLRLRHWQSDALTTRLDLIHIQTLHPDPEPDPAVFVIGLSRGQLKTNFFIKFLCLLLCEGKFTSFFKDKKSKRSHKTVGIKVFLTIFA
jgi:hypothetical protein